ncbi:MAG: efflux RND transporter permease subunit, partial [Candidatus Binatia bacterium]
PESLEGADLRARVEAALAESPHLTGLLVSPDRRLATIVVEPNALEGADLAALIEAIRKIQARETTGDVEIHVTGLPVAKHDVARLVDRDQLVLVPVCLGVLSALLALAFRSVSGVLLPLAVTAVSLVVTLGAYAWSGLALNPITSLLPPVVMVLSFMTSVHVYHGWRTADRRLTEPVERLRAVVRALAEPAFFAAFTTALGFGSLVITDTPAVAHFGAFAAIGVLVSWAVGMTLVPVVLTWLAVPDPARAGDRPAVARALAAIADFSVRFPVAILATAAAVTVLAALGIPRITSDTDLVRFLKPSHPLARDTAFIDVRLGASSTIEVLVARRDGEPMARAEDLRRVAAFTERSRGEPHVAAAFGLPAIVAAIH